MRHAVICSPMLERQGDRLCPSYMDNHRNNPYLGPYLLAAVLNQSGLDATVVDLACRDSFERSITGELAQYDVLLLSCNSANWPTCRLLVEWIKEERSEQTVILGGMHASLFGEDLMRRFPLDCVVRGEGEKVIVPLVKALKTGRGLDKIPGLIYRKNGHLQKNSLPQLLTPGELEELPVPLFSQVPPQKYKALPLESSRGCKGSCIFCAIPFRRYWRPISPAAVVDRIEAYEPFLGITEKRLYSVVDDCFTADRERALAVVNEVKRRGLHFQATYDARIGDLMDEALVSKLSPHTEGLLLGAESFLPATLKLIGKPITPEDIVACAKVVHRCGIAGKTVFSFIIGFPWESKQQIRDNISKIAELVLTYGIKVYLQWHTLTPGSTLWQRLFHQKAVSTSDMDDVGFLFGEKWFNLSSSLSIDDRLDISDMVVSIQKVISLTKPPGRGSDIAFTIPPYLKINQNLTADWCARYQRKMADPG